MKLLMDGVWNITEDHRIVLEAAESFLKTHHYVPENMIKNISKVLEKIGPLCLAKFSGLVCIEASKQVYCGYHAKKPLRILIRPVIAN